MIDIVNELLTTLVKLVIAVAGTAFIEKPQKEFIAGATGAGVRTLLNYILEA